MNRQQRSRQLRFTRFFSFLRGAPSSSDTDSLLPQHGNMVQQPPGSCACLIAYGTSAAIYPATQTRVTAAAHGGLRTRGTRARARRRGGGIAAPACPMGCHNCAPSSSDIIIVVKVLLGELARAEPDGVVLLLLSVVRVIRTHVSLQLDAVGKVGILPAQFRALRTTREASDGVRHWHCRPVRLAKRGDCNCSCKRQGPWLVAPAQWPQVAD